MLTEINKWRVWCDTESTWVEIWNPVEPTTCPNNNSHSIDTSKTSIIDTIKQDFPISEVGNKVWVHSSSKPQPNNKTLYIQWIGSGDDVVNHILGGNDNSLLHFNCTTGTYLTSKDIKFDPIFGDVYIHEGYLSWHNAGDNDHVSVDVMAEPSPLQTFVNKDLVVDNEGYISYSTGGPGTGTHGFAGIPHLISRSFSMDGEWDYSETTGLVPNFTNTGAYRMSIYEMTVHRFMNDIPVYGTNPSLFRMVSDESFKLPPGYFIRISCHNASDTNWHATAMITIYRERTYEP